jgi:hypothetical protein
MRRPEPQERIPKSSGHLCWRALEDLNDANPMINIEEMRRIARIPLQGPALTSSESAPGRSEPGVTPGASQYVPASLREMVGAALRALHAGRLDLAVDMLERLSRALDGDSA